MKKKGITKGFTLVELMVTVTIMMIMAAVVFFNYGKFNDSSLLSAFAYDLSLTIRQAQAYGIATRQGAGTQSGNIDTHIFDLENLNNFKSGYGVHFDGTSVTPLILFVDLNNNLKYDGGSELLQSYTFQRGIGIKTLGVTVSGTETSYPTLDITFNRPDPEATMFADGAVISSASSARIVLQNGGTHDLTRSVTVYQTGQISAQ